MAKKTHQIVMLINSEHPNTGTKYIITKSTKGQNAGKKHQMRKYDPVVRKHCLFVERKLPNPKT